MDTRIPLEKSEEEKFNEDFLKIAFPDWMRSSKEAHSKLASKIMMTDRELKRRVTKLEKTTYF